MEALFSTETINKSSSFVIDSFYKEQHPTAITEDENLVTDPAPSISGKDMTITIETEDDFSSITSKESILFEPNKRAKKFRTKSLNVLEDRLECRDFLIQASSPPVINLPKLPDISKDVSKLNNHPIRRRSPRLESFDSKDHPKSCDFIEPRPLVSRRLSVATTAAPGGPKIKNRNSLQQPMMNTKRRSTIVSSNRILHGVETFVEASRSSLDHRPDPNHPDRINFSSLRHGSCKLSKEIVESINIRRKSRFRHRRMALANILTPRQRFQRAARMMRLLIRCLRTYRRISVVSHISQMSFAMMSSDMVTTKKYRYGLSFDPNDYKANSEKQLNDRTRMILTILPEHRTEEELEYALKRLRASVEEFAEFPLRMQEELARVGWLDQFEPKRIIIRQGHQAETFYFILAGTALVTKNRLKSNGDAYAETVSILGKGKTFGELAILRHEQRTHNVISQTNVTLLTVCRRDFLKIFMHRMDESESELISFMRGLPEFEGYPLYKLPKNKPSTFAFTYFRVGVVICCDSRKSDFLVIIRSGYCRVVKCVRAARPTINGLIEAPNKVDKYDHLNTSPGSFLPSIREDQVILTSDSSPLSLVTGPKMTNVMRRLTLSIKQQDKLSNNFLAVSVLPNQQDLKDTIFHDGREVENWFKNRQKKILQEYKGIAKSRKLSSESLASIFRNISDVSKLQNACLCEDKELANGKYDFGTKSCLTIQKSFKKMIVQKKKRFYESEKQAKSNHNSKVDFSSCKKLSSHKLRNDETALSEKNVFIHVETLGKNDVFGLSSILFDENEGGSSVSLISEGTECILLSKEHFLKYIDSEMKERLTRLVTPYPSNEVLKQNMQNQVNWDAYKFLTVHDQVLKTKKKVCHRSGIDPEKKDGLSTSQVPGYRYMMQA